MSKVVALVVALLSVTAHAVGTTATALNPATRPSARTGPAGVSNRASPETFYVFGGNAFSFNSELWGYSFAAGNWAQPADTNPPSARSWSKLSWDVGQGRLILFGGSSSLSGPLLNDVWSFNPSTLAWTQLTVSGAAPSPRFAHALVYVPHLGQHLVFGGGTATNGSAAVTAVDAQLWLLSVNAAAGTATWTQRTPTGAVPARASSCFGYDPVRRRLIVYGGETPGGNLADTVQYDVDANTWTTDAPTGDVPSARGAGNCTFDERARKLVLYGGTTAANADPINEMFSYDPVGFVWKRLTPSANPGNLTYSAKGYSPTAGGLMMFGGRTAFLSHSQATWTLRVNANPIAAASSASGASVGEGTAVSLSSSASTDVDGDTLTHAWTQTAGPAVTLTNADTATPSFTAPLVGSDTVLSFSVTVNDGSDTSTASVSVTVRDDAPTQLAFTTPPRTFSAGTCGGAANVLTVELRGASGSPASARAGGVSVTATSTGGGTGSWFRDASCTQSAPGGAFSIPAGASAVNLYYCDTAPGSPTVSLTNGAGLTNPASQTHTVVAGPPAQLVITTPLRTFYEGTCSPVFNVGLRDVAGNAVLSDAPRTLALGSSQPTTRFYSDPDCQNEVTSLPLPVAEGSALFYARDTAIGSPTLTVASTGLSSAQQVATVEDARPIILRDAVTRTGVGQPYRYNAFGAVQVTGARPMVFGTCGAPPSGFSVQVSTGAVSWMPSSAGVFDLCVTATNADGADSYTFQVTVSPVSGMPPTASFTASPDSGPAPLAVTFDGAASAAHPGTSLTLHGWRFGDGSAPGEGAQVSHTYVAPGGYMAALTVVDAEGQSSETKRPIRVATSDGRRPPAARIVHSSLSGEGRLAVDFGCECAEGDAPLVAHVWDFSDGTAGAVGAAVRHDFGPGRFRVRLTVVDASGLTAVDEVDVVVREAGREPPTCRATAAPAQGVGPLETTLVGHFASDVGAPLTATWSLWDGSTADDAELRRTLSEPGVYRATLQVVDDLGLRCSASVDVAVLDADGRLPPRFVHAGGGAGSCGLPLEQGAESLPVVAGGGPFTFSLEAYEGVPLPEGLTVEPSSGRVDWAPTREDVGEHPFLLVVRSPTGAAFVERQLSVRCGATVELSMGCGCQANAAPSMLALGVVLLLAARRKRAGVGDGRR